MGFKTICPDCGKEREVKNKANIGKRCRMCHANRLRIRAAEKKDSKPTIDPGEQKELSKRSSAAKEARRKFGNPMQGRKHKNRERFRGKDKVDAINVNWDDMIETTSGLKRYRQTCLRCGADRGYQQSTDWKRTCWSCKCELSNKYTKDHKRLRKAMSVSISERLRMRKSGKMGISAFRLVDYTFEDLLKHLESLFQPGMTWENYGNKDGQWEVDHIKPDSAFDYSSPDDQQFKECWSLSNLQPLWSIDNRKKSAKWEG